MFQPDHPSGGPIRLSVCCSFLLPGVLIGRGSEARPSQSDRRKSRSSCQSFTIYPLSTLMQVEFPPDVTCGEEVGLHLCITCVHTVLLLGHLRVAVTLFLNDNISTLLLLVARGCFVSQTPLLMTQTACEPRRRPAFQGSKRGRLCPVVRYVS